MARTDLEQLVYQMDADISRLEKSVNKAVDLANGSSKKIQSRYDELSRELDRSFGAGNFGKAAADSLGDLRSKLLGTAAEVPVLGGALGALGAAGIVAAAGIAGLHAVMERTEVAIDYGASIAKLATVTGVTTDFIQEFNFAARQSEVDVAAADESLKALNQSLGLVQSGLSRKQLANAFKAVGFSQSDLEQFRNAGDLLPVLADRIVAIGNAAEQAAVAKRLGVSDLLPLLKQGAAGFNKLAQEARDLGVVMDSDLIQKSEEAKRKLTEMDDVVKAKANATFARFADTILSIKSAFNAALEAGLKFVAFASGTTPLGDKIAEAKSNVDRLTAKQAAEGGQLHSGADRQDLDMWQRRLGGYNLAQSIRDQILAPPPPKATDGVAKPLVDPTAKTHHEKTDRTAEAIDEAQKEELAAHASLLQALLEQAATLAQQMDLERQIYDAKRGEIQAELQKKFDEVDQAKDIKDSKKVQIEQALIAAAADKLAALDAQEIVKIRDLELEAHKRVLEQAQVVAGYDEEALSLEADMSVTRKARAQLEADALALRQKQETAALSQSYDEKIAKNQATPPDKDAALADLARVQGLQRQQQSIQNAGPFAQYMRGLQDLDTEMQNDGVKALESLSSGLDEAILNGKSLGDVFKNVTRQMVADLMSLAIKRLTGGLVGDIASLFPGFASGGDFTVGGMSGIDANIVPLRLTAGERVTITPPGQMNPGGGAANQNFQVHVVPSPYFDVQVSRISGQQSQAAYAQTQRDNALAARRQSSRMGSS